jgi:hypothetical protein
MVLYITKQFPADFPGCRQLGPARDRDLPTTKQPMGLPSCLDRLGRVHGRAPLKTLYLRQDPLLITRKRLRQTSQCPPRGSLKDRSSSLPLRSNWSKSDIMLQWQKRRRNCGSSLRHLPSLSCHVQPTGPRHQGPADRGPVVQSPVDQMPRSLSSRRLSKTVSCSYHTFLIEHTLTFC